MRRRPVNLGTYYAYAMLEFNEYDLPKDKLLKTVIDCSDTFCGIALYKERLKDDIVKNFKLSYLGVCWDEE